MYKYRLTCDMVPIDGKKIVRHEIIEAMHPDECKRIAAERWPKHNMESIRLENLSHKPIRWNLNNA